MNLIHIYNICKYTIYVNIIYMHIHTHIHYIYNIYISGDRYKVRETGLGPELKRS